MMYDDIKQDIYLHFVKYDNLKRYNHSIKVMEKALEIVEQNNFCVDLEQLKLSAMLHDVGKVIPECEQLKIIKERKNNNVIVKYVRKRKDVLMEKCEK